MASQDIADGQLKEKIIQILKDNGINTQDEVEEVIMHEPDHLKGEHMATATLYVEVKFKNAKLKPRYLFAKRYFNYQKDSSSANEIKIMENEASFYTEFLPAAREFCKSQSGSEILTFFPECLYGDAEFIVLDNVMLNDGYTMVPKLDLQDYPTSQFAMRNLGKFHAVSFAMAQKSGVDKFKKQWELVTRELLFDVEKSPYIRNVFDSGLATCINILKEYPVDGGEETITKLTAYLGNTYEVVERGLSLNPSDPLFALNHGDCWNNNMMFKMSPKKEIEEHMLVDFQITRFGSPSMDLAYYLFTSLKPEVRRAHLKDLLQEYLTSFKATCDSLNADCSVTFEDLFGDFKKRSGLGFFSVLMTMSTLGAMKEMDMSNLGENPTPESLQEMFQNAIKRWIERNPDRAANIAKETVAVLKEYEELTKLIN